MAKYDYPIIVIGAGAGGLVIAIGAAKAGKKVLLVDKGTWGGDCTNFGCIPSKSLIESAHAAHATRHGKELGINATLSSFECKDALERTRRIVQQVKDEESPDALHEHHVDTLTGLASFTDSHTLKIELNEGGVKTVTGKNIIIATGSHPVTPSIQGLEDVPHYNNETIFDLTEIPTKLAILGGGPIGCELGQAFSRLGSEVSIIQRHRQILKKEEPEAARVVEDAFKKEGIHFYLGYHTAKISQNNGTINLFLEDLEHGDSTPLEVSHLLIATGRKPTIASLNLEAAGVNAHEQGVMVDSYGRTSRKNIWAVGDVAGHALFTHVAENEARSVLRNLLLPFPFHKKEDSKQSVPRVTYTDPEVASFGATEHKAKELYGESSIAIYYVPFNAVDRAVTSGRTEGFIKVITKKWSSKILGATIVGPRAGEMLPELSLAKHAGIPFRKLASLIHPYPTYNQGIRKAADQWLTKTILPFILKFIGKK